MFNTIRQNLRSFLRIPENLTAGLSSASASLPTASLPTASLGGSPPEVQLVRPAQVVAVPAQAQASAGPVAATPRPRRAPVDAEGFTSYQRKMQHEARLKTEFGFHEKLELAGMKPEARRKVLADFDRFVAARPLGNAATPAAPPPALQSDNQTPTPAADGDPVADIISQLEKCLKLLKEMNPDVSADDSDADEASARAALAVGNKSAALRHFDAAITKLGAQIVTKNARASAKSALFRNLRGTAQSAPLSIEASDNLDQRRAKARKNMFQNLQ